MNNDLMRKEDFLDLFYVASAGQDKAFIEAVEMVVADTPTVDAVGVCRCKDCKHTDTDGCGAIYCEKWDMWEMLEDFYCAYGERRNK